MDKLLVKRLISRRSALQKQIDALHAEVADIDRLVKRYANGHDGTPLATKGEAGTRKGWTKRNSATQQVLEVAAQILAIDSPKKPRDMAPLIEQRGVKIPGNNPANTLSAMLSGDSQKRFETLGPGKGWVLRK